jgi:hypothetical protein
MQVHLPPDASAVDGDPTKSGTAPFFGFTGLSCPSVGNCTAVGGYEDKHDNEQGLILTERNGVFNSVSCPSASRCIVVGQYPNRTGKPRGLILSLRLG